MRSTKFSTFAGVFTPSILTILGVIMYLRLGWVVGQAGIISTVAIVLVAHIISITTGLSISSIATDKRIKTGGIYYMLSRSLGLPIGGSIGITIFIGTALSISLYIVGFSENFLAADFVKNFTGLGESVNSIRIIGTAILLFLVVIAFISTSVAIKTQYFILTAIFLSLISIALGFIFNTQFYPEKPLIGPSEFELPIEVLFAVFFPAVTGFTAGVAMSGDLRNPKKSIPVGTMTAIGVGLVVYITLAIALGLLVNRDLLINDYNFLFTIAYFSPLVLAGIWGATLSSALGGILGAPRILQAISVDRITPGVFGKGIGRNNEPRNALLLTFVIAEAGILIGELNMIARIVSIFYIAAYGFINLSFALEKWASTDFRPTFKISRWIGIIGFASCFIVMLRLDLLAMLMALIVLGGLYFYIKQKSLRLDFGDVWQSVWSTIIRSALKKMDKSILDERNWHPNIILFSGGTKSRPHLVELGKNMVGKQGFLSNFDLIPNKTKQVHITKTSQSAFSDESDTYDGVFTRRQEVEDIYKGIENIASNYGFSGVEPNTIMLGWSANSKDPVKLVKLLNRLSELDFNMLLVNYDKSRKFGKQDSIDVWVRGGGNNGSFILSLIKFIWMSHEWRNAKIRVLTINPVNDERDNLFKSLSTLLEKYRISADIKIVNNEIEQKPVYEIIQAESINASLVFLGMPEVSEGKEISFIYNTNKLCDNLGTVILVKASSYFKELKIITGKTMKTLDNESMLFSEGKYLANEKSIPLTSSNEKNNNSFDYSRFKVFASLQKRIYDQLVFSTEEISIQHLDSLLGAQDVVIQKTEKFFQENFSKNEVRFSNKLTSFPVSQLNNTHRDLLTKIKSIINDYDSELPVFEKELNLMNQEIIESINHITDSLPPELTITLPDDSKFKKKKFKAKIRNSLSEFISQELVKIHFEFLHLWGLYSLQFQIKIQQLSRLISNRFYALERKIYIKDLSSSDFSEERTKIENFIKHIELFNNKTEKEIKQSFLKKFAVLLKKLTVVCDAAFLYKKNPRPEFEYKMNYERTVEKIPEYWNRNQKLIINNTKLELSLLGYKAKIRNQLNKIFSDTEEIIKRNFLNVATEQLNDLKNFNKSFSEDYKKYFSISDYTFDTDNISPQIQKLLDNAFNQMRTAIELLPENAELIDREDVNDFEQMQFESIRKTHINVSGVADFIVLNDIISEANEKFEKIPEQLVNIVLNIRNQIRNLAYSLSDDVENIDDPERYKSLISIMCKDTIENITKDVNKIKSLIKENQLLYDKLNNTLSNKLAITSFVIAAENHNKNRGKNEIKRWSKGENKGLNFVNKINQYLIKVFWFDRFDHKKLSIGLKGIKGLRKITVDRLREFTDKISLDEAVFEKIPYYYKQLFLRNQYYISEFWVGRQTELSKFKHLINTHNSGINGAIALTGELYSGKTFFINYALRRYLPDRPRYVFKPVEDDATELTTFHKIISNTLKSSDQNINTIGYLKEKSILIFDNFEFWIKPTGNSEEIIKEIIQLIEKFSKKHLFILLINNFAYRSLIGNTVKGLDDLVFGNIELKAMKVEEIQNLILKRHYSSQNTLILEKRIGKEILSWQFARLFSKLKLKSDGNPGAALDMWISEIRSVEEKQFKITYPVIPSYSWLSNIRETWKVLFTEFCKYGYLSAKQYAAIKNISEDEALTLFNTLERSGFLIKSGKFSYKLNRLIYPYLVTILKSNKLLPGG